MDHTRILFLVSSMQDGGAERIASLLCNHWAENGLAVKLMPTFSRRGKCLYYLHAGVQLDFLADHVRNPTLPVVGPALRLFRLRQIIKEWTPDVIVSFLPNVNVAAILASLGLSVPVVVSERTYPPAVRIGRKLNLLRKLTYPSASRVIMQTEEGKRWIKRWFPCVAVEVIANPVVYPLLEQKPVVRPQSILPSSSLVVLAVGRLSTEKGFSLLVEAFGLLATRFPQWSLVILGDGIERERLELQREELQLNERVQFPGRVGNLDHWYERADLYVLSSWYEGFPNALLEAMAYGLPAVSVDCDTGPRDIIRPGIDGLLVPPVEGVKGLAESMAALMDDSELRSKLAVNATSVRDRFGIARIAKQWSNALNLAE